MSESKETIFSIARENRTLRWVILFLSVSVSALAVVLVFRPASPVWVIGLNGEIHRGEKEILSWEPLEASRRAIEILFVPTDNRDAFIDAFYAENLRSSAKASNPKDRFVSFQVKKLSPSGPGKVKVEGVLQRVDKQAVVMTLVLSQVARSEMNPFGLVVSQGSFDEAGK